MPSAVPKDVTAVLMGPSVRTLTKRATINKHTGVACPDHESTCPPNNTCCLLTSGKYGCCPYLNATRCPGEKCCHPGHVCKSDGTCSPELELSLSGKQLNIESGSTTPSKSESSAPCSDGSTCLNGNQPAADVNVMQDGP